MMNYNVKLQTTVMASEDLVYIYCGRWITFMLLVLYFLEPGSINYCPRSHFVEDRMSYRYKMTCRSVHDDKNLIYRVNYS